MPPQRVPGRPRGRGGAAVGQAAPRGRGRGRGAARGGAAPIGVTTRARVAREAEAEIPAREIVEQIPVGDDFVLDDFADKVLPDIRVEEVDQTPPVVQPPPPTAPAVATDTWYN